MNVRAVSGPGPELSFGTFNRENKEMARAVPGLSDDSSLSSLGTNREIPSSLEGQTAVGGRGSGMIHRRRGWCRVSWPISMPSDPFPPRYRFIPNRRGEVS